MAHGKAIEDLRWYVKRDSDGGAECGPYNTQEEAEAMMIRRLGKVEYALNVEQVDITKLHVHRIVLPQEIEHGKPVPAEALLAPTPA
jgi:hypothetical protein